MSQAQSKTIVIVDDDDGVRDSTAVLLESCGYGTASFVSAEDLLEEIDRLEGACLLIDIQMPGTSGLELLEKLRERSIRTPAILMTANAEHIGERAVKAGALTVLRKPFSEEALLHWIAIAFGPKASRD